MKIAYLKLYLTLFIISSFLSSSFREMATYSSKRLDMSGLCVSVAKNSTKLQRLLLSVRVNSSTQLEIAKIIKQSPELKILKSLSKRLAFQHLGLMKNIANWCYFDAVVFPNKPSLFAVIPEALLAIQSLAQKCHEIAVYLTTGTLEGDIERERVTLQGKSKQLACTYYPYFTYENLRSLSLIPQFSTQGSLSELTISIMS
ncbi:hypothetical protein [Tolypothrix sp. VBCCA 56010]|uniref:hypothetical protein n=1 Tax=Tolypothrix sp. VBCCA 56010 TaxID=3137731 RepID=UPI003D7DF977